jgi:hypothetical protein
LKYDKEHIDIIINQLNEGNGRVAACKAAGIDYSTFLDWYNDPEKSQFSQSVKKAEEKGENRIRDLAIRAILAKFSNQWQAAAWWLERNHPEQFKNKTENQVNVHTEEIPKIEINFRDAD